MSILGSATVQWGSNLGSAMADLADPLTTGLNDKSVKQNSRMAQVENEQSLPPRRKDVADLPGGIEPGLIASLIFYKSWFIVSNCSKMQFHYHLIFLMPRRLISEVFVKICFFKRK